MKFDTDIAPTVAEIVRLTGVTERTARRWLRHGGPAYAVRYIELQLSGRILPRDWPAHWRFNHNGLLETDSCHPALRWQQITWYQYIIQGWYESLRLIPPLQAHIEWLTDRLPVAQVVELEAYRAQLAAIEARAALTESEVVALAAGTAPREKSRRSGC